MEEYCQALSPNLNLPCAGFFIDKCGFLGASPDGIVVDNNGHPVRLVEVKCPFNAHEKNVEQACNEIKTFCIVAKCPGMTGTVPEFLHMSRSCPS